MRVWALRPDATVPEDVNAAAEPNPAPREHLARGPFQIVAEEAHEDSEDLLFLPEATATDWAKIFSFAEVLEVPTGLAACRPARTTARSTS